MRFPPGLTVRGGRESCSPQRWCCLSDLRCSGRAARPWPVLRSSRLLARRPWAPSQEPRHTPDLGRYLPLHQVHGGRHRRQVHALLNVHPIRELKHHCGTDFDRIWRGRRVRKRPVPVRVERTRKVGHHRRLERRPGDLCKLQLPHRDDAFGRHYRHYDGSGRGECGHQSGMAGLDNAYPVDHTPDCMVEHSDSAAEEWLV